MTRLARKIREVLAVIGLIATATLLTAPLQAAPALAPKAPAVVAHWVDADGSVESQHAGTVTSEWTWIENTEPRRKTRLDDPDPRISFGGPALRIYVHTRHIPPGWLLKNYTSDEAKLVTIEKTNDADPRLRRIVIDTQAAITTLDINFSGPIGRHHLVLTLTVPGAQPTPVLHRTCADFELRPLHSGKAGPGRHLFLGLACAENEGQIFFHVVRSADSRWAYYNEDESKPELLFTIDKSAERLFSGDGLFKIRTRDLEGRLSEHSIFCAPNAPSCRKARLWDEPINKTVLPSLVREQPADNKWSAFLTLGSTFLGTSSYNTTLITSASASQAVITTNDRSQAGALIGTECFRKIVSHFQIGLAAQWAQYRYAGDTATRDTELGIYVMPRGEFYAAHFTFWGALGLGLMDMTIGSTAIKVGTASVSEDTPIFSFAISPRLGMDIEVARNFLLGAELTYVRTSGSITGGVTNQPNNGAASGLGFSNSFTRQWFSLAGRIGLKF